MKFFQLLSTIILWLILIIGCNSQKASNNYSQDNLELVSFADTSAEKVALKYFKWMNLDLENLQRPLMYDSDYWYLDNYDEISKTLEVAETLYADSISLVLIRYSVGSDLFRESVWLRKYKSNWTVSVSQYFSVYDDDPFNDGKLERAERIINKEEQWTDNSSEKF
jgi:hypothetical protein